MNISEYIAGNEQLSKYDFITVYSVIVEMMKDGIIKEYPFSDRRIAGLSAEDYE